MAGRRTRSDRCRAPAASSTAPMAPPAGHKERPKFWLLFMDRRLGRRRMKTLKRLVLRSSGSPKLDK
ncbi:unnamed protein product [Cuscuta campestris]|uniref:Uncharacterized protein n=1 Tax=Cuscuta campestris TaxID=132261 RepID=A0A484M7S0_9ASTE|nr:unnamed protein product [Cuscuta campestris]